MPDTERAISLGAALMALLLAAHGMGYGAMLTSGRAVRTKRFARAFHLAEGEQAVCFVSVGTPEVPRRTQGAGRWVGAAERLVISQSCGAPGLPMKRPPKL